jgi:hypothetical protein
MNQSQPIETKLNEKKVNQLPTTLPRDLPNRFVIPSGAVLQAKRGISRLSGPARKPNPTP